MTGDTRSAVQEMKSPSTDAGEASASPASKIACGGTRTMFGSPRCLKLPLSTMSKPCPLT